MITLMFLKHKLSLSESLKDKDCLEQMYVKCWTAKWMGCHAFEP